jgi:hypothetical protein
MKTIFTIVTFLIFTKLECHRPEVPVVLPEIVIEAENPKSVILSTLQEMGVSEELSYIILAQAMHETGNFTSAIFWENNNPFGMKCPKKRPTKCIGTNRAHGIFESIKDATIDYVWWMEFMNIPFDERSVKKYVFLLKEKRYFEDDVNKYYIAIKKHKETV